MCVTPEAQSSNIVIVDICRGRLSQSTPEPCFLLGPWVSPQGAAPTVHSASQLPLCLTPLLGSTCTHGFLQYTQYLPCSSGFSLVSAVLNDIISTMFNRKFMEELFKPQELYSKKALRTVYNRLAHASIMRLNQASMDKVSRQPLCQLHCRPPTCRGWSWGGIK